MLTRMTLAAAAIALTTPAMATCLEDVNGAQCDVFLDEYRAAETPVGTTMVWPQRPFLIEEFDMPAFGTEADTLRGNDVFYWDGETAFVVPDESGPPIKIADW